MEEKNLKGNIFEFNSDKSINKMVKKSKVEQFNIRVDISKQHQFNNMFKQGNN